MHSRLSIIVVNWNTRALLERCLRSIAETAGDLDVETWVVDNASADGSAEMLAERFPEVHVLRQDENLGFAKAVNRALAHVRGLVLLLNSDTRCLPGALEKSVARMDRHRGVDVLGCRLVGGDGRVQASCGLFPSLRTLWWQNLFIVVLRALGAGPVRALSRMTGVPLMPLRDLLRLWDSRATRDVDWVSGAFLLTRREVFDRVGLLDERFWLFGEDLDWCWRVKRQGGRVVYFGGAEIVHLGGGSAARSARSDLQHYQASLRLYLKHHGRFEAGVYRTLLGAAAVARMFGLLLVQVVEPGRRGFGERFAREWGMLRLRP